MKSILFTELSIDFLVQGLGLHTEDHPHFTGKLGRHEVELVSSTDSLQNMVGEIQVLCIGKAQAGPFRTGDILMAGSDDLLDRAFHALDEMEQRGVVVALSAESDLHQVSLSEDWLYKLTQDWKAKKIPYLCLFMVDPVESEGQAKLVTLVRKVLN
jgi:hypothetical protein